MPGVGQLVGVDAEFGVDLAAALPAILILKDDRACVLTGWFDGEDGPRAQLLLPETGQGLVRLSRAVNSKDGPATTARLKAELRDELSRLFAAQVAAQGAASHWHWAVMAVSFMSPDAH